LNDLVVALLGVFLTLFPDSVLERKNPWAHAKSLLQSRGPFAFFSGRRWNQNVDQEDIVRARATRSFTFFAPVLIAAAAILTLGVILTAGT